MAKKNATSAAADRPKKVKKDKTYRKGNIDLTGKHPVTGKRFFIMHHDNENQYKLEIIYGARKDAEAYIREMKPLGAKVYTEEHLQKIYDKESNMRSYIQERCAWIEGRQEKLRGWIEEDSPVVEHMKNVSNKSKDQKKIENQLKDRLHRNKSELARLEDEVARWAGYIFANYDYLKEVLDGKYDKEWNGYDKRIHTEILKTVC